MLTVIKNSEYPVVYVFTSLTANQKKRVWNFLETLQYVSFQQFPDHGWLETGCSIFFIAECGGIITGFASIDVKRSILASLVHGPLAASSATGLLMLDFILRYLKKRKFLLFRWMPPPGIAAIESEAGQLLSKYGKFLPAEKEIHWTTTHISLAQDEQSLLKSFSENHRRSIKKAKNISYEVTEVTDQKKIKEFAEGYIKMYRHRGNAVNSDLAKIQFQHLFDFFKITNRGFFITAMHEGKMLGGICVIYTGNSAFYHKGFIDHTYNKMPINHLVFFEAMLKAKRDGMSQFDMGGYAPDTLNEQIANINRFKNGFKGQLITFPQTRLLSLNLLGTFLYKVRRMINS
jgi:hypothetical protein